MRISDLALCRWPSHPTISPDGQRVVYTVTRIDLDDDAYRSDLWVVPADGSEPPRRLTFGPVDSAPSFSPDGRWLAFRRGGDGESPRLHVMPSDGGEPRQVCEHPLGIQTLHWAPDSRRIAYVARVPQDGRYGTAEDVPPDKEPPRRITTFRYMIDGVGYTFDRPRHVFVVDALDEEAEPAQVTDGDYDHNGVAWHPGGEELAFVAARHDDRDTNLARDVFVAPAAGGPARRLTDTSLPIQGRASFTPDGETVCFAAHGGLDVVGRTVGLFAVPADGGQLPQRLTDEEAIDVGGLAAEDRFPTLADEEGIVGVTLREGACELTRFPLDGSEPRTLLGGRVQVGGYDRSGDTFAVVVSEATSAGEVTVLRGDDTKVLTRLGADMEPRLRPMEEIRTTAPDGYPVHGWVVKPDGEGPFPTLLAIHGGPHWQYGYALFDEAQVYAGAGYAVVMGNPRGSSGYGNAHGRAVVGDFGGRDHADLTALLDAALADPDLDAERTGILGGSYGGFMTAWMIAHTDRFRAAVVERGFLAPDSFLGSSDIGSFFVDLYLGADPARQAAQNPLLLADRVRTPTLVIHSEQDWRCPVEQGKRYFVALKRNGVETEMLLFPGEGHELSRSGLPSHRVARFEAILDWFGRHLLDPGEG